MKKSKYKSKKVYIDGIMFASKDEAKYYVYLLDLKKKGLITKIELQPKYELLPKFRDYSGKNQRAIKYIADFIETYKDGTVRVIDIKGFATPDAKMKRKMFMYRYPEVVFVWIASSIKYGDEYGWIEYDELQTIRRKNKREKTK